MEPCTVTLDVGARSTSLVITRPAGTVGGPILWADERPYSLPAPVAVQVLCAALLALAWQVPAADVDRQLWEGTRDLW